MALLAFLTASFSTSAIAVTEPCLQKHSSNIFCVTPQLALQNTQTGELVTLHNPLTNNSTVNLYYLPSSYLTIRGLFPGATPDSVVFGLDNNARYAVDNNWPFTINGDIGGIAKAWNLPLGEHVLRVTPYTEDDGKGLAGPTSIIKINVINQFSALSALRLIDARADRVVAGYDKLPQSISLDLAKLPSKQINFEALAMPTTVVRSVKFTVNGKTVGVQSSAPFSLAGDKSGDFYPWQVSLGTHRITATPYTGPGATGLAGTPMQLQLTLTDSSRVVPTPPPAVFKPDNLRSFTYGPVEMPRPANAIVIPAGSNIQAVLNRHIAGTTFYLSRGVYSRQSVTLEANDKLIGEKGAILDGGNSVEFAIFGAPNAVVKNLEIRNYNTDKRPTVQTAANMVVENNHLHHNHGSHIKPADNAVIRFNKLTHGGRYGMSGTAALNARVEYNEIAYNNTRNLDVNYDAGGTKFAAGTQNMLFSRNYVHHNNGTAIWFDGYNLGTRITENLVENNTAHGIMDEINKGTVIKDNVVRNSRFGILVSNSASAIVQGNTLSGNTDALVLRVSCRTDTKYPVRDNVFTLNNVTQMGSSGDWTQGKAGLFFHLDRDCPAIVGGTRDEVYSQRNNRFLGNKYTLLNGADYYFKGREMSFTEWKNYGFDR